MRERRRRTGTVEVLLVSFVVWFLTACGQGATTGPGRIHWDRQVCEHCQMVIGDRRYAVQLRMPGEKTTKAFDDLGCALLWLDAQGLLPDEDSRVEVWVRDPAGKEWVDGRKVEFAEGFSTPMNYGFATASEGFPLAVVRARVESAERLRRSGRSAGFPPDTPRSRTDVPGRSVDG